MVCLPKSTARCGRSRGSSARLRPVLNSNISAAQRDLSESNQIERTLGTHAFKVSDDLVIDATEIYSMTWTQEQRRPSCRSAAS